MADRLALIIEGMLKAVACCGGARPIGISGLPVRSVAGPLLMLIWRRLRGIAARFSRHIAIRQAAALRQPSFHPRAVLSAVSKAVIAAPEAAKDKPARKRPKLALPPWPRRIARQTRKRPPSAPSPLPRPSLPGHRAWLLLLIQETALGASQLRHFLADPEVAALLAEDPHLRGILRPLCHMLGIRRAQALSLWPPAPLPSAPPPAAPQLPHLACTPGATPPPDALLQPLA